MFPDFKKMEEQAKEQFALTQKRHDEHVKNQLALLNCMGLILAELRDINKWLHK